jgi:selenocysteine-specific translation elongation factor
MNQDNIIEAGHVIHFFAKINVAAVDLTQQISVGDTILVKGPTTDFEQKVESMQIERQPIQNAQAGQSVGLKFNQLAKEKDTIYKKL